MQDFEDKTGLYNLLRGYNMGNIPFSAEFRGELDSSKFMDKTIGTLAEDVLSPENAVNLRKIVRWNKFGSIKFNEMFDQATKAGQGLSSIFNLAAFGEFSLVDLAECQM